MGKIDIRMINNAYDFARRVAADEITETTAVTQLVREHGMNQASATIYVRNLATMLAGNALKRTMSAPSFEVYLDRIINDYDAITAKNAVVSVRSHIAYYNGLGRGSLNRVAIICDEAEARLR